MNCREWGGKADNKLGACAIGQSRTNGPLGQGVPDSKEVSLQDTQKMCGRCQRTTIWVTEKESDTRSLNPNIFLSQLTFSVLC